MPGFFFTPPTIGTTSRCHKVLDCEVINYAIEGISERWGSCLPEVLYTTLRESCLVVPPRLAASFNREYFPRTERAISVFVNHGPDNSHNSCDAYQRCEDALEVPFRNTLSASNKPSSYP